jgi:hypothetical protein
MQRERADLDGRDLHVRDVDPGRPRCVVAAARECLGRRPEIGRQHEVPCRRRRAGRQSDRRPVHLRPGGEGAHDARPAGRRLGESYLRQEHVRTAAEVEALDSRECSPDSLGGSGRACECVARADRPLRPLRSGNAGQAVRTSRTGGTVGAVGSRRPDWALWPGFSPVRVIVAQAAERRASISRCTARRSSASCSIWRTRSRVRPSRRPISSSEAGSTSPFRP